MSKIYGRLQEKEGQDLLCGWVCGCGCEGGGMEGQENKGDSRPHHLLFRGKGVNTGLVRQAWGMSLFDPM